VLAQAALRGFASSALVLNSERHILVQTIEAQRDQRLVERTEQQSLWYYHNVTLVSDIQPKRLDRRFSVR
jgi:hypothetical protein